MNAAQQRLERLIGFLQQDPDNAPLHADAFDCALAAHDWAAAARLVDEANAKHFDPPGWQFRAATLALATRDWARAEQILQALQASVGPHPAITHNLAWVAFEQGDFQGVLERLESAIASGQADDAILVLQFRAQHRLGQFDAAITLARQLASQGQLPPEAAGVASLIAVDDDQLDLAKTWSDAALQTDPEQMEALVARAAVALSESDAATARRLSERALQHNPADGRAASSLGFAHMLALDVAAAIKSFRQAVGAMPGHIGTWHGLGWACLLAGDLIGAKQAFDAALELDRNFSETHGALAVLAALTQHPEDAQAHIKLAQGLDANDLSSQYAAALLSGEASDAARITRLADRLLKSRGLTMPILLRIPPKS